MRRLTCYLPFVASVVLLPLVPALRAADAKPAAISPEDLKFFETKIRPVLTERCYKCHSHESDKIRGGLVLDSREGTLHGGNTGPAIVPGKPKESLLIQAVAYKDEDLQMPPKGDKLSDAQIADLTEWVRRGAPDPRSRVSAGSAASYGGVGKNHWAFQPVKKPALPTTGNPAWAKTPVDDFILAKLEANGLTPNAPADKSTLIRRVTYDLIGLPPTEKEIEDFLIDTSPNAYARVVDRLLASPHYGERWARYWLDVARFSDTKGDVKGQVDRRFPHAWTYRDYVIDAFNRDKPYNQFIVEQLAADKVLDAQFAKLRAKDKNAARPVDQSALAALGFLTLGNQFQGRMDDIIGDQIDTTSKAFLGLTVACARCHDHKFDPIPTKDYYSLYGVFANSYGTTPALPSDLPALATKLPSTPDLLDYMTKADALKKKMANYEQERIAFRKSRTKDRDKNRELQRREREITGEIADLETTHPGAPARANTLHDVARSRDYTVLLRGEAQNKGDTVPRRFLEILSPDPKKRPEWHEGSGRLQLALAIADPKNPMTARVLVNRLWQQHWGTGFVSTPDDLGNMSSAPTHPELLDWLAATFVEGGWSVKNLQRQIVLSAAYQQSGHTNAKFAEIDPNNKFLWRANLRRLDFEAMHDALLQITGELDRTIGGRPVLLTSEGFATRRALYVRIDRQNPPELLTQFDFPSPDVPTGRRYETLVPQQALFLMNSPMVIETSRKLVDRASFAALKSDEERVTSLYLAVYQRPPTTKEIALAVGYVKQNPAGTAVDLPGDPAKPAAPVGPGAMRAMEARKEMRQQAMAAAMAAGGGKRPSPQNGPVGGVVATRQSLDAWTKLAHALFQSNEAMFYN
ncbi:MAG: hypothetical protein RLZZ15_1932 [Verrucomicrobiota bacterium]